MPAPCNERQSVEHERDEELPSLLEALQAELAATAPGHASRRERIEWQIRRAQKRLVEIAARLAG